MFTDVPSQNQAILKSLQRGEKLTPIDMLRRFGSLRASARIHNLRDKGYDIKTDIIKTPSGKRIAQYSLNK